MVNPERRVIYEPDPDYHGDDDFDFVVNDCPFFLRLRNLYAEDRTAKISIHVSYLNRSDLHCELY